MAVSLAGKCAIVTGAGSGINLAFAAALLRKRCNVLIADLALRPEASSLIDANSTNSAKAVYLKTDVRRWSDLSRMFSVAQKEFGRVDIVCPGAGVYEPPFSNFWHPPGTKQSKDDPAENHFAQLDINLTHPIRTTQLALTHFLSSPKPIGGKAIILISSIAGQCTPFAVPIYNASKHGINGFVRSLGPLDRRVRVRVTAVAPGVIKTPLWLDNPDKLRLVSKDDAWVTPEFVADVMTDLIEKEKIEAEASSEVTGEGILKSNGRKKTVEIEGGLILEVAKDRVRVVEQFNDPGPSGEGNSVGNMVVGEEEIFEQLGSGNWGRM